MEGLRYPRQDWSEPHSKFDCRSFERRDLAEWIIPEEVSNLELTPAHRPSLFVEPGWSSPMPISARLAWVVEETGFPVFQCLIPPAFEMPRVWAFHLRDTRPSPRIQL